MTITLTKMFAFIRQLKINLLTTKKHQNKLSIIIPFFLSKQYIKLFKNVFKCSNSLYYALELITKPIV